MALQEAYGDLWAYRSKGHWVAVTTNGVTRHDGCAAMGAGVALQANQRFPGLAWAVGQANQAHGNIPHAFPEHKVVTFPTKHHFRDNSDLALIEQSARHLMAMLDAGTLTSPVYLPRPGVGFGRLAWSDVKKALEPSKAGSLLVEYLGLEEISESTFTDAQERDLETLKALLIAAGVEHHSDFQAFMDR